MYQKQLITYANVKRKDLYEIVFLMVQKKRLEWDSNELFF